MSFFLSLWGSGWGASFCYIVRILPATLPAIREEGNSPATLSRGRSPLVRLVSTENNRHPLL